MSLKVSKSLCYILRHNPFEFDIIPDSNAYCDFNKVLKAIRKLHPNQTITVNDVKHIVDSDNKKRYAFSKDKAYIKATYGHSYDIPDKDDACIPPRFLFHGTNLEAYENIKKTELSPMNRKYVCSSDGHDIAIDVANRRKNKKGYVLLKIHARRAFYDKAAIFYEEECGIYQSTAIPKDYIEVIDTWRNE